MVMPSDDDPFFKKKLEEAYKTLEEAPLPEDLINRFKKSN